MWWASLRKEVWLVLRDRGTLASLFLLPIVFIGVFGAIFARQASPPPRAIAVYVAPAAPDAEVFAAAIAAQPGLRATSMASAEAARKAVAQREHPAAVIVTARADGAAAPIELHVDPRRPLAERAPLEAQLTAIATEVALQRDPRAAAAVAAIRAEAWILTEATLPQAAARPTGFAVSVPANAVLFGFFIALTVALAFADERRTGAWRRALASPVSRPALVLAKLGPYLGIAVMQLVCLFAVGAGVFGLTIVRPGALGLMLLAIAACATSLGLLLASLGQNERVLGSVGSIALLVMGLLGGCMVPRALMPDALAAVGGWMPHAAALDGVTLAVLGGDGVAMAAMRLSAFAVLFAGIGAWRFRFMS